MAGTFLCSKPQVKVIIQEGIMADIFVLKAMEHMFKGLKW
jgi:hypothetical protein